MRRRTISRWAALTAIALGAMAPGARASDGVVLAPHRAVYDIVLDRVRGGAGISDMSGRMVYELTGNACDGYTQSMRFVSKTSNQDGTSTLTDLRTTSWEDAIGRSFRFNSSQFKDSKLTETTTGDARRAGEADRLKVALTEPARKELELAPRAMFPVEHSRKLLAAAIQGQSVFPADLYDGSEKGEKVYATVSYIGRPRAPGDKRGMAEIAGTRILDGQRAWPVSISYYEPGTEKDDALPTYELAFLYYENGVSRRLLIDYGAFSVRGVLKEITFLDPGKCSAQPTRR